MDISLYFGYNFHVQAIYNVKTEHFEGPLDLLLDLIEKRKLFINDISLAAIADDYIAYVEKLEELPISDTANFVLIASTLVLIKSKSLLPTLDLSEEEESSIEDLEIRLRVYKEFKEIAKKIEAEYGKKVIRPKSQSKIVEPIFSPDKSMTLESILSAMAEMLRNLPKKIEAPKATVRKVISLEQMMDNLAKRIETGLRMSFKSFASKEERINAIVGFLAMLELVKRGIIAVKQDSNFSDIEMEQNKPGVPNYN